MIREKLPIHKQFLVISSPVEFSLIANNGTDKVLRPAGVWQLDCYKLLPEKYMKNYPVFNLDLEYDETKIPEGFAVEYYFTNINLGDSLKGVSGDLVELSENQLDILADKINTPKRVILFEDNNFNYAPNNFPTILVNQYIKNGIIKFVSFDLSEKVYILRNTYLHHIKNRGNDHGTQYVDFSLSCGIFYSAKLHEDSSLIKYYPDTEEEDFMFDAYFSKDDGFYGYFRVELIY